jgi:hypothetical protein
MHSLRRSVQGTNSPSGKSLCLSFLNQRSSQHIVYLVANLIFIPCSGWCATGLLGLNCMVFRDDLSSAKRSSTFTHSQFSTWQVSNRHPIAMCNFNFAPFIQFASLIEWFSVSISPPLVNNNVLINLPASRTRLNTHFPIRYAGTRDASENMLLHMSQLLEEH